MVESMAGMGRRAIQMKKIEVERVMIPPVARTTFLLKTPVSMRCSAILDPTILSTSIEMFVLGEMVK